MPTEYGRGTIKKKIERQLSANKGGSGIIRIFESLIEDPGIGSNTTDIPFPPPHLHPLIIRVLSLDLLKNNITSTLTRLFSHPTFHQLTIHALRTKSFKTPLVLSSTASLAYSKQSATEI